MTWNSAPWKTPGVAKGETGLKLSTGEATTAFQPDWGFKIKQLILHFNCCLVFRLKSYHSNLPSFKREVENPHLMAKRDISIQQHTCHAAGETRFSGFLPVRLTHPAAQLALRPSRGDGHSVPLVLGHNHSLAFYSSHVLWVCTSQPAKTQSSKLSMLKIKWGTLEENYIHAMIGLFPQHGTISVLVCAADFEPLRAFRPSWFPVGTK